jgi:DNA-binding NtrC family response regulator
MTPVPKHREILIIDDDRVFNDLIVGQLTRLGYACTGVNSWGEAEGHLGRSEPDLILLDVRLPDTDGLAQVGELANQYPVIMLTAYGSVKTAVEAMRRGAADYLVKPIDLDELELILERTLGHEQLRHDIEFVRAREQAGHKSLMIGHGGRMRSVAELVEAVAVEDIIVHITGESGVGKEVVAREIHRLSRRAERNFVAIDCCTLQETLFESELFGHEKGAFTGADRRKEGLIEGARGGTLFLDEIGEIGPAIQAKLLRVLETGRFRRVGGTSDLGSDARILTATNRDLEAMVRTGKFRADLYFRLNTFVVKLPPLREHREDIPDLVRHFLANHDFSRRIDKKLAPGALDLLSQYDWPGNVRELRNVVERAIILSGEQQLIREEHLGLSVQPASESPVDLAFDHEPSLDEIKQNYFRMLFEKYRGNRAKLASALGISERNVYRMLKKYDIG